MASFPVTNGVTTIIPPPENYVVDFENPKTQHTLEHFMIFGFLGSLAFICLVQRLYTKHYIVGGLRADDYLITSAWVASLIMESVQIWSISIGGLCHHAWEMPIEVYKKHMITSYIAAPVFIFCNGMSKTSLLTFYLRISTQRAFIITIWATMTIVACYTIVIAALLLFGCRPISASWDPNVMANAKCVDVAALYIAIAIANIFSDVVLFIIPIPTVMRLKMPLTQKLGASLMFGIGSVTIATSIVRMAYLPSLLHTNDIPWVAAPANVWVFIEANLFIICGSMPTFRKFFQKFAPKWLGSSYGSQNHPSRGNTYKMSGSMVSRQHRTGYSQFDDAESDSLSAKELQQLSGATGKIESIVTGHVTSVDCEAAGGSQEQNMVGKDIIVNGRGIGFTRTIAIKYST
ncbi:hypothetical protein V2G26_016195 [Clonostachys chloroleuca]